MFGYVRPLKGELKVKEYEQFKAVYCGLCHALKKKYGLAARFIVNYDFTFLALLLSNGGETPVYCRKRCIASPLRKKSCASCSPALELCAQRSVVLTYWKLKDTKSDSGFFKRIGADIALMFLRRPYKKAAAACGSFAQTVKRELEALGALEREHCSSIDRTADCFASILRETAHSDDAETQRILSQLLYHIGRWIYISDAIDDFDEDMKSGGYNPIKFRFEITDGKLGDEEKAYLKTTLDHSASLAAGALELLPGGVYSKILENIIYLGLPWVAGQVLSGKWNASQKEDIK